MRLFTVSLVAKRLKKADRNHLVSRRVVMADSIEQARAIVLECEGTSLLHAVGVEDHGNDPYVNLAMGRLTTAEVTNLAAQSNTAAPSEVWTIVEANPVMPQREPFKIASR